MSISTSDARAARVWCDERFLWLELADQRRLAVPLHYFPRLMHGTAEQRAAMELSDDGGSLHWPELDEDISVEGLLRGERDVTRMGREHAATCEVCRRAASA